MFICNIDNCNKQFTRKYSLRIHQDQKHSNHGNLLEKCFLCHQLFQSCDELQDHYSVAHRPIRRFVVKESAFQRKFITYRYNFLPNEKDFIGSQKGIRNLVLRQIMNEAAKKIMTRVSLIFIAEMVMTDYSGQNITRASIPFRSPSFYANGSNLNETKRMIQKSFAHQSRSLDEFMRSGSNWTFSRSLAFDIEVSAVNPIRGGCQDIPVKNMQSKAFLYSPSNRDNKCFLYCLAYFLLYGTIMNKASILTENFKIEQRVKQFNKKGVKFPISVDGIKRFLAKNDDLDLSVNVLYRTTNDEIYPFEYGLGTGKRIVNLLLVETKTGGHYMLIKKPDSFLRKVYNLDNSKRLSYKNSYFCLNCLNSFSRVDLRDEHSSICSIHRPRIEKVPSKNENIVRFKNQERKHWLDYIAYLDFECILPDSTKKCPDCNSLKCKCDGSHTDIINDQLPICYSFVIIQGETKIIHENTYAGENAHIDFISHLLEQEKKWIKSLLETKLFINMTFQNTTDFNNATKCYICNVTFGDVVKCRDHCHFTGKYMGAACQQCNLRRRRPKKLKIFVHNCSKYDMHFIIQALSTFKDQIENINVLPYNGENFRTLKFNSFELLDTLAFLQSSLSQLSDDLRSSGHEYKLLKKTYLVRKFGNFNKERFDLVLSKSFFPYEYCTSLKKMKKTRKLPKIESFYSRLSEKSISIEDHSFAKKVWKEFACSNLIDYTKLYCKIDTILLAEIFQAFRKKMYAFSGLDPAHYISLPAYGYDSMLLVTGVEIELPTDINMIHFLEMGKRGGVSFINTRYLSTDINSEGEVVYQDRNNLYGEAQINKLPLKDFRWLSSTDIYSFDVHQNLDGEKGYFLECDLHYPSELHEWHSNFPLAPEILEITFDNLSPYAKMAIERSEGKRQYKDTKLMSTFHDRKNYVLHGKNLQLYLSLGLKLIKIHRILEFTQDFILRPYIEKTTLARQLSTSDFEMGLFKKLVKYF